VATCVSAKGVVSAIAPGDRVRGRIRRFERYSTPIPHYVLAIEFTEVESNGIRYRFYADLADFDGGSGVSLELNVTGTGTSVMRDARLDKKEISSTNERVVRGETYWLPKLPGVAVFFVRGSKIDLPAGFRTTWKTQALKP
jgi:hypothetical protein